IRSIKDDKETEFIASKEFVSTEEPYVIDYVPEEEGEYYLEVTDLETNQTTGTSFYASDWTNPADVVRLNGLKISADKAKYTSADTAVVSFEGIRGAKALIALEKNGKIVSRKIRDIGEELVKEEIELDKSMVPNLYVHVSLLQNYDKKNDRSLRLYGAVPLLIEDEDTKLHISLETPESIRPQETFSVKVKSDKNRKMEYAVAVVDEGLLDLTTFKTPDPWTFFYQKLASRVELFDNYDSIMEKPFGEIHQILQVGGELLERMAMPAARRGADLGFEDAERFKPVSLWQGTLVTNEKGEGTVEFTMPNYMGSVRIMAVAADGPAYGFAEKTMAVKAPVVVLESLPRTLKAGDDFVFPVKVFALEENIGDIEVYYSFNGRTQSQVVNLKKGEEKTVYFSEQIEPAVGLNNVAIGVKSGVYNYEETVEMAVNSDALPVSRSESAMIKDNETATFVQNKNYVKNTVKSSIVISNTPALGIDQRLRYLIAYPYGCVEQTTSAVLPQLFLERLMTDKQYDKKEVIQNINAGIKRLVNNFQTSEGGFSYWPGEHYTDEWGTGYAATFLILARQQGYYVPDNAYSKLLNYLKKRIRERKIPDNSGYGADTYYLMRSYGLYLLALSGSPLLSEMNYTYAGEYDKLNVISKLYLAGAYQLAGEEKTAREILEKSNAKEKILATADVPEYYRYSYGSVLRDLSVYLHIYYTLYGSFDPDALDTVLLWLRSDSWYNTQATAWALLALSNFVEDSSDKNIKGAVVIDGVATTYEGVGATRMTIPETAREVKITPETPGNTFVTYYWEGTPLNEKTENIVKGFTLERKFYDTEGKTINPRELESGRTFWLEVAVTPTTDKRYISKENMALVQILPTGWEIENTRLSGEQNPQWIREKLGNIESCARYMDIRDDRILWFFDYQPYGGAQGSGVYRFFVKINTVTRGTFDFPGTKLEAMYDYNFQSYLNGYPVRVVDKNMPAVAENPDSNK
ncbi:MAG: alpha-2-macroglobulin family protein, partial [Fusobacteriaceae bacterium]|nr:alpha-2-macroglobulin family protein [Fusobacteriaceae bacterium]